MVWIFRLQLFCALTFIHTIGTLARHETDLLQVKSLENCTENALSQYQNENDSTSFWNSVRHGECFNFLPKCKYADKSTLPRCKNFTSPGEIVFCNSDKPLLIKTELKTENCRWSYEVKESREILYGKHILFIGDSRVRYMFLQSIFWLYKGYWLASGHNQTYKSLANQHYFGNWSQFYETAEIMMEGKLIIDSFRGFKNIILDLKYNENWYFVDIERNLELTYISNFSGDLGGKVSYLRNEHENKRYWGPFTIDGFLIQVVPDMNVTHIVLQSGWGDHYLNNSRLNEALRFILAKNIKIIYNSGYGGVKVKNTNIDSSLKVRYLDMFTFCEQIKLKLERETNNDLKTLLRWDRLHYRSWVYPYLFDLILNIIF
jgi:hypothetical protein